MTTSREKLTAFLTQWVEIADADGEDDTAALFRQCVAALSERPDVEAVIEACAKMLHTAGDNAYCRAMEMAKADLCLGEGHKIKTGSFTLENLKALESVRAEFGKADGLWAAEKTLRSSEFRSQFNVPSPDASGSPPETSGQAVMAPARGEGAPNVAAAQSSTAEARAAPFTAAPSAMKGSSMTTTDSALAQRREGEKG